jgi:hypothetical protein
MAMDISVSTPDTLSWESDDDAAIKTGDVPRKVIAGARQGVGNRY